MKRIGIMGGTFNPIHNAHLIMAEAAFSQFHLDKVLFMPSQNPPHKNTVDIISVEHRIRMIRLAIDGNDKFEISYTECGKEGKTYTSDTLLQLKRENPDDTKFYFILGGDSLMQLEEWNNPKSIFENCHLIVTRRGQTTEKVFNKKIKYYQEEYSADISVLDMEKIHISSEKIRELINKREPFSYYCPDKVTKYIAFHELYGFVKEGKDMTIRTIHSMLKCICRPKRFLHMLGVQYTSAALAMTYGVALNKAELAGILHDCAKYLTFKEQIVMCDEYEIGLTETEKENPVLIHGKLGAEIAKRKFHVSDKEILTAIRFHITGRPNMTNLEKIIFIADCIEPNRNERYHANLLGSIRHMAFINLDMALVMCLENTMAYLSETNMVVDLHSKETYDYYKKLIDGGQYESIIRNGLYRI
jgi:nicotinate-nucleotide adenylyltransferase